MTIGQRDRLIYLEQAVATRNATGEVLTSWQAAGMVWAHVKFFTGTEAVDNAQQQAVQRAVFNIRYREGGLNATYRVTFEGRAYDIESVAPEGRKESLLLTATTRT